MVKVEWFNYQLHRLDISIPFVRLKKFARPHICLVKEVNDEQCSNEWERKLYTALTKQNIYVTPNYNFGRHKVNLVLIPFRIAIIDSDTLNANRIKRKLLRKGWQVVCYSKNEVSNDFYEVMRRINRVIKKT
ncbi:hypothetical protein [Bacillus sp. FJAT-45350]|uniref:hypothetical protein n=1 Tax=Bacillus sp. FJAT-45350 TaxID=2011014 RepID=UPI000BB93561|nr:hypothetical protein [Bacillus sp. FJAT-45350]